MKYIATLQAEGISLFGIGRTAVEALDTFQNGGAFEEWCEESGIEPGTVFTVPAQKIYYRDEMRPYERDEADIYNWEWVSRNEFVTHRKMTYLPGGG